MALALIWLTWKIYPLLKTHGGIKELFHLHPLKRALKKNKKKKRKPKTAEVEEAKPKEESGVDKDIDET